MSPSASYHDSPQDLIKLGEVEPLRVALPHSGTPSLGADIRRLARGIFLSLLVSNFEDGVFWWLIWHEKLFINPPSRLAELGFLRNKSVSYERKTLRPTPSPRLSPTTWRTTRPYFSAYRLCLSSKLVVLNTDPALHQSRYSRRRIEHATCMIDILRAD